MFRLIVLLLASALMAGCGLRVPQLHEAWEEADVDDDLAYRIKKSIYCELRIAVAAHGTAPSVYEARDVDLIPDNWAAQITLTLQVDEKSAISASVQQNRTLRDDFVRTPGREPIKFPQSFSLPFSATVSSQATRVDKYYQFLLLKNLKKPMQPYETSCKKPNGRELPVEDLDRHGSSLLFGNLGIKEWMKGALRVAETGPSSRGAAPKADAFSYDIRFAVFSDGSVNPTWRLVNLSTAVAGLPMFRTERTRTHQLLLTLGPTQSSRSTERTAVQIVPSQGASNLHFTGEIQQAVSNGFRSAIGQ